MATVNEKDREEAANIIISFQGDGAAFLSATPSLSCDSCIATFVPTAI